MKKSLKRHRYAHTLRVHKLLFCEPVLLKFVAGGRVIGVKNLERLLQGVMMNKKDGERLAWAIPEDLPSSGDNKWEQLLYVSLFCLKRSPDICSRKSTLKNDTMIHCG